METTTKFAQKYDIWRDRLLDLSGSNRLLNFRPTKISSVQITKPTPQHVLAALLDERALVFPHYRRTGVDANGEEQFTVTPGDLDTSKSPPDLDRSLARLTTLARTYREERGVNTLYLGVGSLSWRPSDDVELQKAPLLLVPVILEREDRLHPYRLLPFDEDPELNPTLAYLLRRDFGFDLPVLSEDSVAEAWPEWIASIRSIVEPRGWRVDDIVWLAQFQFKKLAMYRDLEQHAGTADRNDTLMAIAGCGDIREAADIGPEEGFDAISPHEVFTAFDADASQLAALLRARKGQDLVVQGPPGTGKSQTIANLIAQCLFEGKKVLFVSEKMAALDVVYERLRAAGLAPHCLELHSDKASKRDVLTRLQHALNASPPAGRDVRQSFAELVRLRQKLNEYVRALHEPLICGFSAYDLHGEVASLTDAPHVNAPLPVPAAATDAEREAAILGVLGRVAGFPELYQSGGEHVWRGCAIEHWSLQRQAELATYLGSVIAQTAGVSRDLKAIAAAIGCAEARTLKEAHELLESGRFIATSPLPPLLWLTESDLAGLGEAATRWRERQTLRSRLRMSLEERNADAFFSLTPGDEVTRLTPPLILQFIDTQHSVQRCPKCGAEVPGAANRADARCDACNYHFASGSEGVRERFRSVAAEMLQLLGTFATLIADVQRESGRIAAACGLETPEHTSDVDPVITSARLLATISDPAPAWLGVTSVAELQEQALTARAHVNVLHERRRALSAAFHPAVFKLPVEEILSELRAKHRGRLRVLHPRYHRLMRQLRACKSQSTKLTYDEALTGLDLASAVRTEENWIKQHEAEHVAAFAHHYRGEATDWSAILERLATLERVNAALPGAFSAAATRQHLLISDFDFAAAANVLADRTLAHAQIADEIKQIITVSGIDGPFSLAVESVDHAARELSHFLSASRSLTALTKISGDVDVFVADLRLLDELIATERDAARDEPIISSACGRFYSGWNTDWERVETAIAWAAEFRERFGVGAPEAAAASDAARQSDVRHRCDTVEHAVATLTEVVDQIRGVFDADVASEIGQRPLDDLEDWCVEHLEHIGELAEWIDYRNAMRAADDGGVHVFIETCRSAHVPPDKIARTFLKRLRVGQLDAAYERLPSLTTFRAVDHENAIETFRRLDRDLQQTHRRNIVATVAARRPNLSRAAAGQAAFLRRELTKQRRHAPLRKLFTQAGNIILEATPCLLMSPLSVATYLPKDAVAFDVVIFDEASQMPAEDAIGAILRGKQLVVAGDTKQMPPSRFFAKAYLDGEDEDDEATDVPLESVLEDCEAAGMESRLLEWHYRSKDEGLIAFSNAEFYDNALVTFPSPSKDGATGIRFEFVENGVYDRGNSRTNRAEARRVAELVHRHYTGDRRGRSLGVIALSAAQADAIEAELELLFSSKPHIEALANGGEGESLFVKPLENVQGDERDEVIISVGYAKDANGKFALQLGPVSAEGGERRLNVAFTRARYRCTVVSSVRASDIDETRVQRRGPVVLKRYLEYAELGRLPEVTLAGTGETESPFEEAVVKALHGAGIQTETQVGVSRYRIDIAVKDSREPGRYLLGIECDGAMYHSSKVARDRDRLRDAELRARGWKILRIWSTEWMRNPHTVLNRILARIKELEQEKPAAEENATDTARPSDTTVQPQDLDLPIQIKLQSAALPTYREAVLPTLPREYFYDNTNRVTDCILKIVAEEGPIHSSLVATRVARAFQLQRNGRRVEERMAHLIGHLVRNRIIDRRGEFLWSRGEIAVKPRTPGANQAARAIEHVAPEEIAAAALHVVKDSGGIELAHLVRETARLLGYGRTGARVEETIGRVVHDMLSGSRLSHRGAFVTIDGSLGNSANVR